MENENQIKYFIVPEQAVKQAASVLESTGEPDNGFSRVLKTAEVYKSANMTPLFLWNQVEEYLTCVASETFNKKLH